MNYEVMIKIEEEIAVIIFEQLKKNIFSRDHEKLYLKRGKQLFTREAKKNYKKIYPKHVKAAKTIVQHDVRSADDSQFLNLQSLGLFKDDRDQYQEELPELVILNNNGGYFGNP